MRPVPVAAKHQFGVFTAWQAVAEGWSATALNRAVTAGKLTHVRRGCFAEAGPHAVKETEPDYEADRRLLLQSAAAVALMVPTATVSHSAALVAHGLPTLGSSQVPCVTLPPRTRTLQTQLHLHRQALLQTHLSPWHDLRVTSVARTCLDIARERGLRAGIVAADAALARGLATESALESVYRSMIGTRGSVAARNVCRLADGRSESPLESISRLVLMRCATVPEVQVEIRLGSGERVVRVDFYWPDFGVVGEADGRIKYGDSPMAAAETTLWLEKQRQEQLADLGLTVIRWGWRKAMNPERLLAKVDRALQRRSPALRLQ